MPRTATLSANDRLLLGAIRHAHCVDEPVEPLLRDPDIDWSTLPTLAAYNRVGCFVARLVMSGQPDSIADSLRGEWRTHLDERLNRVDGFLVQMRAVVEHFGERGINPLLYKGIDFQTRWYRQDCPRGFGDIDIVVQRHEIDGAARALRDAGYLPSRTSLPLSYYSRYHLHATYVHANHGLPLELHWALDSPYSDLPDIVAAVVQNAESAPDIGNGALRPRAVDALAMMAIHLEKHVGICSTLSAREARLKALIQQNGLLWVVDVVRWLKHESDTQNPEGLLSRMRELGSERSLVVALRLACDLGIDLVPDWAREIADRLPGRVPLVARVVYPRLSAGRGYTKLDRWVHARLFKTVPGLTFKPIRVVEAVLPRFSVPGDSSSRRVPGARLVKTLRLGSANALALISCKIRQRRQGEVNEDGP